MGGGVSGKGAESALKECGASVAIADESKNPEAITREFVSGFDLVIVSPSVPAWHKIYQFAEELKIGIYGEIELGARLYGGKIVAVTGTNGKTTVTRLIGEILKRAGKKVSVCGNIGVSFASSAVFDGSEIAAVEVSSFQLESIQTFRPDIAIITNITPDHIDRHGTFYDYAVLKRKIAQNQTSEDHLILSRDDIPLCALESFCPGSNVLYTSLYAKTRGAYLLDGTVYFFNEPVIKRSSIRLAGDHNVANALNAVCAAKLLGIPDEAVRDVLAEFCADDHRIKMVGRVNGKNYFNDSKGTNIGSTLAAVRAMSGDTALILGGKEKGFEFDALFDQLPESVIYIAAIGETADKLVAAAGRRGKLLPEKQTSLRDAVYACAGSSAENVLLSPAASSFDMFKDYAHRGEMFEAIVKELRG